MNPRPIIFILVAALTFLLLMFGHDINWKMVALGVLAGMLPSFLYLNFGRRNW